MKTFLIIACLTGGQLLSAASPSFSPLPLSKSYWKDEAFLKSFNGSYRVNARVEPVVSTAERGLLVSIQPLMADGKREEALKKLTSHATAKSSAAVLFNMGNIQFELGKMKEAGESYQKAIKIHPSFLRAHRNLGFVFARSNDWKQAMPALEEAIRLGDQHGATYGQLAYGRLNAEQYASALQAYRLAQVTEPNSLDWKAGVAQCLQHLQRNEEALALIDEVIRARPDEVSYYLLQGSIQISLQRGDDALANLELVRRIGKLDAENHLLLGTLHLRSANAHLARPVILSALAMEKKPPLQSALNTLDFTTQTQNWKLAQDVSAAIEKSWPEVKDRKLAAQKMRLTALIAIESGSDPELGVSLLEKLIKQDPLDAVALVMLGKHRVSQKRSQEAILLFEQASRVEGSARVAHIEIAKVHVASGDYASALKHLDAALKERESDNIRDYRNAIANLAKAAE